MMALPRFLALVTFALGGLGAAETVPLEELDPTLVRRPASVTVHSETLPGIREVPLAVSPQLPQSYHDQIKASLAGSHPQLQIVVDRRSGTLGQVSFSLLAYRSGPTGSRYQLSACVVRGIQAWRLELALDEAQFDSGLLMMLNRIQTLGHGR